MNNNIKRIILVASLFSFANTANSEDMSYRNKTRRELSHGLMKCIVAYEYFNQKDKTPLLIDAFNRFNKNDIQYFEEYHKSALVVLAKDEEFMSKLDIETKVCDFIAPEKIDLGDSMKLDTWREGDDFE